MTPIERVRAVLSGQKPDHPPVSFWHHFPPQQVSGRAAVDAHVAHVEAFDLDFLKVMNDNGYPHATPIADIGDLASIVELRGDEAEFQRQHDLLAELRRRLGGRVLMTTTIFNAWAVLRQLISPPKEHNPPDMDPSHDAPSARIKGFIARNEDGVRRALRDIGGSLANFARRCIAAGADGVFLSVRDDWVDADRATERQSDEATEGRPAAHTDGLYRRLVRDSDLAILAGAHEGTFNMLHVCGNPVGFRALAEYPVHAINWADRAAGPSIADAKDWAKPAICGGVDNLATLPNGTPADVEREVADALRQAGGRPILISPGCTYDPQRVPRENLAALARAAHTADVMTVCSN